MLKIITDGWNKDKARRILWLPVLFALGISFYFSIGFESSKWITLGIIEGLILLAIIFRHHINILKIFGCMAIVLAGFTLVQLKSIWIAENYSKLPEDTFYFKGKILILII